jgi:hypothetical protein
MAFGLALLSCTSDAAPEPAGPSASPTGAGAVMTDSGVTFISIAHAFEVAKLRGDGDAVTTTITYTGTCLEATGRITVTADDDGTTSTVDVGPFAPDTPTPVTIPLGGSAPATLSLARTSCT